MTWVPTMVRNGLTCGATALRDVARDANLPLPVAAVAASMCTLTLTMIAPTQTQRGPG